jgi:hypothetical protein
MVHPGIPNEFVMLGVIHRDANLEPLLLRWLKAVRPDVVTLEISRYGLAFRQSRGEDLKLRVHDAVDELLTEGCRIDSQTLDALLAYIALPSEFTVASGFAEERGIPLHLIDMDSPSRSYLGRMEELLAKDNLAKLLCGPGIENGRCERAVARLFLEKGVSLFSYTEEMRARDSHMRDRIRSLMESHGTARFLHICGWQHLSDPLGLYTPLNPRKVFIYDEALCI